MLSNKLVTPRTPQDHVRGTGSGDAGIRGAGVGDTGQAPKHRRLAAHLVVVIALLATSLGLFTTAASAAVVDEGFPVNKTIQIANEHSGLCLDVPYNEARIGQALIQWYCHGQPSQQFVQERTGNLRHKASGLCVAGTPTNLAPLRLDRCGRNNQWNVQEWADNGGFQFQRDATVNGQRFCMDVPASSTRAAEYLIVWQCTGNANQIWRPTELLVVGPN